VEIRRLTQSEEIVLNLTNDDVGRYPEIVESVPPLGERPCQTTTKIS
jgi:hypothetical protein